MAAAILAKPITYTLGLYEINCADFEEKIGPSDTLLTIGNIMSWIPIIGSIIGAIRFAVGYHRYREIAETPGKEDEKQAMMGFMIRGIAEIFCAGTLLMLIDIIVTLARCCLQSQ